MHSSTQTHQNPLVYVGTQAKEGQNGLFTFRLNESDGKLTKIAAYNAGAEPGYLVIDSTHHFLYVINKDNEGTVRSYFINQNDGSLSHMNDQPCPGGPAHISLDQTNKVLLVAAYGKGKLYAFPIEENGHIGQTTETIQLEGSSVNKDRQEGPHAHFILVDPTNTFVFATDLGADHILGYRLDTEKATLKPNDPPIAYKGHPGAGPRHFVFHPSGKYAYLINELNGSMTVLGFDHSNGVFNEIQTINTLPEDFKDENTCAAVRVSADGKFVYGSNRGHDSIAVYSVDHDTGKLTLLEIVPSGGKHPRDFNIDLKGKFLIVGNRDTNNILTYHIDQQKGTITSTGNDHECTTPICFVIIPYFVHN